MLALPVNTARLDGPYSPVSKMTPGSTRRVDGTEHPCLSAVLAKNIAVQCFLPTQAVDTGARYTLPVSTGRVHGLQNDARVHGPCRRGHGRHCGHPYLRVVDTGVIFVVSTSREHR